MQILSLQIETLMKEKETKQPFMVELQLVLYQEIAEFKMARARPI